MARVTVPRPRLSSHHVLIFVCQLISLIFAQPHYLMSCTRPMSGLASQHHCMHLYSYCSDAREGRRHPSTRATPSRRFHRARRFAQSPHPLAPHGARRYAHPLKIPHCTHLEARECRDCDLSRILPTQVRSKQLQYPNLLVRNNYRILFKYTLVSSCQSDY